jgi:hypothetical protein
LRQVKQALSNFLVRAEAQAETERALMMMMMMMIMMSAVLKAAHQCHTLTPLPIVAAHSELNKRNPIDDTMFVVFCLQQQLKVPFEEQSLKKACIHGFVTEMS